MMGVQGVIGRVSCLSPLQHQRCPCGHPVRGVTPSHCYQPPGKGLSQGMGEEIGALWAVPGQGPCLLQPRWDICLGFTSLPQKPPEERSTSWETPGKGEKTLGGGLHPSPASLTGLPPFLWKPG